MLNNVIDPVTGLPRKLGELYNDRNIRLVGEMRWDAATNKVDTKNLRIISTPNDGGSPAITVIPDGSYTLSSANTSIWIQLRRTAGTTTVALGTSLVADVSTQNKPRTDWIQLFLRTSTNDIVTLGNWVVLAAPQWTKAGVTRGTSIYDAIVGSASNPFATHTTIQGAIDDALDGDRILVLSGQYSLSGPGNSVVDSGAALSWSGKTLTLEGEGYTTVIENTGSLSRAFAVKSNSATSNGSLGPGSRILNLHLKNFNQSVRLDGGVGMGLRHCQVDIFSTGVVSYTAPAKTGTGTFEGNFVKEQVLTGSTFSNRRTVLGTDTLTDTESSAGTSVLDSTNTRIMTLKTSLRVGDTSAPTQALDVVGKVRATTGQVITPASNFTFLDDASATQNLLGKTLVLSTSTSAVAAQTLDVSGGMRTTTGRVHTPASNFSFLDDVNATQNLLAKTLMLSTSTAATAAQVLDVDGGMRTRASRVHSTGSLKVLDDSSATQNVVAKTLILTTDSSGTAAQTLDVQGSVGLTTSFFTKGITGVTSNYTVLDTDYLIVSTGATSHTVTLPAVSASNKGRHIIVKSLNTSQYIQIVPQATQTIDGSTNFLLVAQYEAVTLVSNGASGWLII